MPRFWKRLTQSMLTKKQKARVVRLDEVVASRKAARLELEQAIKDLTQARQRKRKNGAV